MKKVYKCDFCEDFFSSEEEAEKHEKQCGYNPQNAIKSKLVFRLSMIYETMPRIFASALCEAAESELDFLYSEAKRATETNCAFTIYQHKNKILRDLKEANTIKRKHEGRNSSTYKDVVREYPEIFNAIVETLKRKAWNER